MQVKGKYLNLVCISLITSLLIYIAGLHFVAFNEDIYLNHFEENNIYEKNKNADKITRNLLSFLSNKEELDQTHYTEREVSHLHDVRKLLNNTLTAFYLLLLLDVALIIVHFRESKKKIKKIYRLMISSGITTIAMTVILFLLSLNFSSFFLNFHYVFFPRGNFTFPTTSTLITLFPEYFFYSVFTSIILLSVSIAVLLTVLGLILFVTTKKKIYYNKV